MHKDIVPANQGILIEKAINFLKFMAAEDKDFFGKPTDAGYIKNKAYFEETIKDIKSRGGYCSGISSLKARCILISRSQRDTKVVGSTHNNLWFKNTRQLLAKWTVDNDKNYESSQRDEIHLFIEQFLLVQDGLIHFPENTMFDLDNLLPVLTDKTKMVCFKSIGKIFGFYRAAELSKILLATLKKDRFIFLASHNHVGLLFINDNYQIEFFDSNHQNDDVTYSGIDSVVHYFSSNFPGLRADALLPLSLYVFTTNPHDTSFPSVHDIAKVCKNGEISYSPEIPGYLDGTNSLNLSENTEYLEYFLNQVLKKTDADVRNMIVTAMDLARTNQTLIMKDNKTESYFEKTDHLRQNILMHAIISKNFLFAKYLLTKNLRLNTQDIFGLTALMYAGMRDNVEIFISLLSTGHNPLIKDNSGKSVITHMLDRKKYAMLNVLLNHQYIGKKNVLMMAVEKNDIQSIGELIKLFGEYKPNQLRDFLNTKNDDGETALIIAARKGHIEIIKVLCSAGANLEIADNDNLTAFAQAVISKDILAIKCLLKFMPESTLRIAIENILLNQEDTGDFYALLKIAFEKGSKISLIDGLGNTLLMNAIHANVEPKKLESLITIVRAFTDDKLFRDFINAKNSLGESALQIASNFSNTNMVTLLKKYGAVLGEKDHQEKEGRDAIKLLEGFARFLQNNFLESKRPDSIAKICRIELLGYVLPILQTASPVEIQLIRKIVSACTFMHYQPTKEIKDLWTASAKYPTQPDEGQLIEYSDPTQYGTHRSTDYFYRICSQLSKDKVPTPQSSKLLSELQAAYPSLKFPTNNQSIATSKDIFEAKGNLSIIQVLRAKLLWSKLVGEKISDHDINQIVIQGEQLLKKIGEYKIPAEKKLELIRELSDAAIDYMMYVPKKNGIPLNAGLKKLELQCQLLYTQIEKQLSPQLQC